MATFREADPVPIRGDDDIRDDDEIRGDEAVAEETVAKDSVEEPVMALRGWQNDKSAAECRGRMLESELWADVCFQVNTFGYFLISCVWVFDFKRVAFQENAENLIFYVISFFFAWHYWKVLTLNFIVHVIKIMLGCKQDQLGYAKLTTRKN